MAASDVPMNWLKKSWKSLLVSVGLPGAFLRLPPWAGSSAFSISPLNTVRLSEVAFHDNPNSAPVSSKPQGWNPFLSPFALMLAWVWMSGRVSPMTRSEAPYPSNGWKTPSLALPEPALATPVITQASVLHLDIVRSAADLGFRRPV